jgi:hypothetical protein
MFIISGCEIGVNDEDDGPNIIRPEDNRTSNGMIVGEKQTIERAGIMEGKRMIFIKNGPTLVLEDDATIQKQNTSCSFAYDAEFRELQVAGDEYKIDYQGYDKGSDLIEAHFIMMWRRDCDQQQPIIIEGGCDPCHEE